MKKLQQYLECAKAVNTHGIKGALRLENRCDTPLILASLKTMYIKKENEFIPLTVMHSSVQKSMVLTTFNEIDTLEAAIKMKDTVLYANRNDFKLSPGDYFICDLLGLDVYNIDTGERIGVLTDVLSPGAQQVYVITNDENQSFMVPNVPEFIKKISLENDGGIYIHFIEGMLEI